MLTRRFFLKIISYGAFFLSSFGLSCKGNEQDNKVKSKKYGQQMQIDGNNLGIDDDGFSRIYLAKDASSEDNTREVIRLMGGIEKIIGSKDIVILKPNGQWWNQGMTNTDSMKAFIDLIVKMPGFEGEIIIAENHHFPDRNSRGWTTKERNGLFNYNELVEYFQKQGFSNVTKYHWHDGGVSHQPSWGGAEQGGIVSGPEQGDGYVWSSDLEYVAPSGLKTFMNYPVFTSDYSGTCIDFKNGAWKDGHYIDRPVKFINFSALNHHGYTGATASIKNYLGIVDMTCGYRGTEPKGYHNFHSVGFSSLPGKLKAIFGLFGWKDENGENIGGAVGKFMKTIRIADLNIITAEWVGWGSRTDINRRSHAKTILASTDPVALDYYASKYVLLPATKENDKTGKYIKMNDPDIENGRFHNFLSECNKQDVGTLDEEKMKIISSVV